MRFGVFDHMDQGDEDISRQYQNRLTLIEACDRAGLYAYHLAEHHGTPLGLASAPSVFLAAVAARTQRLRFGALVYTLSLYHPLRLIEEICMLDQLSGGRLELGIGRGISPIEVGFYGIGDDARQRYEEVRRIVIDGLTEGALNYSGRYYSFENMALTIKPVQRPHPPLWHGVATTEAAAWAAAESVNIVSNGPAASVRTITDCYRAAWRAGPQAGKEIPLLGMNRHIVIAETDAEAIALAAPAYQRWFTSLLYLWRLRGIPIPLNFPEDFLEARAAGLCLVGAVATVRDQMRREIEQAGINYLLCRLAFGNLPLGASLTTLRYLAREILPAFAAR